MSDTYGFVLDYGDITTIMGWHFSAVQLLGKVQDDDVKTLRKILDQFEAQLPPEVDN